MTKLFIDCDTGIDDSIAILYALRHPQARVVGITTGCGNTNAAQAADNTLRVIQLAQAPYQVPVAVGTDKPLVGEWEGPVPHIHGKNGIGDVQLAPSPEKPLDESAEDFLIRMAQEHAGELTLVTLGRLTNLALALKKAPWLPQKIKRVVMMGGTVNAPGNVSPVAEANIAGDPEAADIVFTAGFDLMMVGLDVTLKTRLRLSDIAYLDGYCTAQPDRAIVDYLKGALPLYMNFNWQQNNCPGDCPVHDPLAMLAAVDPSLFKTQRRKARVECGGTYCRGMVVTDQREYPFDAQFVEFALEVDGAKALRQLLATLAGATRAQTVDF